MLSKLILATVLVTVALVSFQLGNANGKTRGYDMALECEDAIEEYCHDVTDSEECEESLTDAELNKLCPDPRP